MSVPSGSFVHPNSPIGPMVDMYWGENKAFSTPLQGALSMQNFGLSQQGVLQYNPVEAQKLQNAFPALQSSSLDKSNKSVVVIRPFGGGSKISTGKVGSTERGR